MKEIKMIGEKTPTGLSEQTNHDHRTHPRTDIKISGTSAFGWVGWSHKTSNTLLIDDGDYLFSPALESINGFFIECHDDDSAGSGD